MAAKTIVTFHPDVACAVCGRRLLRGERPDVFLSGGQRRMVCELCAPRATHEGWRREVDAQVAGPRSQRPARSRSLLGRLRQLREPARASEGASPEAGRPGIDLQPLSADAGAATDDWTGIDKRWTGLDEEWAGMSGEAGAPAAQGEPQAAGSDGWGDPAAMSAPAAELEGASNASSLETGPSGWSPTRAGDAKVRRALEVFNAGEPPRRVAGVTRALGAASVRAAPVSGADDVIAIVVAWELCWYRYEIDLTDEAAGVRIAAEGMELEELTVEDRVANAAADEHGELSLLAR